MAHYVPGIPTQPLPLVDNAPFHVPYVRDEFSLAMDAKHDVMAAEDRARVQELARQNALQGNTAVHLAELEAQNKVLDEQLAMQKARVEAAAVDAYSPKGPYLNGEPGPLHRPVFFASGVNL